jgi:Arc-like DNA binding domain
MMRTQIRLPDDLHATLVKRAEKAGRTLNAEMVERLQDSTDDQGDDVAGRIGHALIVVMAAAGEIASRYVSGHPHWADEPWAHEQVCHAVMELLRRLAPEGPIVRPEPSPTLIEGLIEGGSTPEEARQLAEAITDRTAAVHVVEYLVGQGQGDFHAGARAFQDKLGSKLAGRLRRAK